MVNWFVLSLIIIARNDLGVDNGQFEKVLNYEVQAIRQAFSSKLFQNRFDSN